MIWFDLDNSPHVPLFRPIMSGLKELNQPYTVSARDFAQTKELLDFWKIEHILIGSHGGKNKIKKILNLFDRSNKLVREYGNTRITLAVSHGSRTQLLAAKRLNLKSVLMLDYEYTESIIFNHLATYLLMPSYIPDARLARAGFNMKKIIRYSGFKEEIYMNGFIPDVSIRKTLGIDDEVILVTIRPPSVVGNYHDKKSEEYFHACLEYFSSNRKVVCLIVNRTASELNIIPIHLRHKENIMILPFSVDGLQLLWNSDIVISGGGTMNRESALLGTPTYSIFTGRRPYLDEYLQERLQLKFIESVSEIGQIPITKRVISDRFQPLNVELASQITHQLIDLSNIG